jgi:hypothetical protein
MAKVSFEFDNEGYINVRGEKYSALEIVNDAGDTALDWMLASDNAELVALARTWGLTPDKDDKTGSVEEKPTDDPENEGNVDNAVDKSDTGSGGLSNEEITSLTDKLNILFGYKVVKGVVQKDSKTGKPVIANQKAAIKITGGVEPKIQADGTIDIPGDVTINLVSGDKSLPSVKDGKFTVKFGTIGGNFICRGVKLSSLEGGPKKVTGQFDISKNELTSLVGSPEEVGSFFATDNKKLTSLAGGPKIIKGITDTNKSQKEYIYDVSGCGLTTLEGNGITSFGPGGFNCGGNKITSLAGLGVVTSTGVTRFDCSNNQLTSLNGIPKPVKDTKTGKPGSYWISNNIQITVFPVNMADFEVDGFVASGLSLTSLSFAPKQIYGDFDCTNNKGAKKLTNQSIGLDRFKKGGGFEEDAGNRIVKIDGEFITSEGVWKDKTYDVNTSFKKGESVGGGVLSTTSGGVIQYKYGNGTIALTLINNFSIGFGKITPVVDSKGVQIRGSNEGTGFKYHFEGFTPRNPNPQAVKGAYMGPKDYDGKISGMGFEVWPEKYKNYINWGTWEAASTGWGTLQPTCAFIWNGKNYGAKTKTCGNISVAISRGQPSLVYSSTYWDKSTEKLKPNAPVDLLMAGGSSTVVEKGVVQTASFSKDDRGWPFIGQATLKDGKKTWFAGASLSGHSGNQLGQGLVEYFKSIGGNVIIAAHGDGGGSTAFVVNRKAYTSGNRQVSVILYW